MTCRRAQSACPLPGIKPHHTSQILFILTSYTYLSSIVPNAFHRHLTNGSLIIVAFTLASFSFLEKNSISILSAFKDTCCLYTLNKLHSHSFIKLLPCFSISPVVTLAVISLFNISTACMTCFLFGL